MARWTDLAQWRGPSPHITSGKLANPRGLVVHIAAGWYEGTIAWQRNKDSKVSSHFIVGRGGQTAQMVDTADRAWTQKAGNAAWLSVECEGFIAADSKNPGGWERLTDAQIDAIARLLLRCHQEYGIPLQVTASATGRGLGHHSMGADWGHRECPGGPIIAQKPAIVARAVALKNGGSDMPLDNDDIKKIWGTDGLIKAPASALANDPKNTHWTPGSYLEWTYNNLTSARQELQAARIRDEAILAAVQGLDTAAILTRIDEAAADSAARDAALLAELEGLASGGATAAEIVNQLAARLAAR